MEDDEGTKSVFEPLSQELNPLETLEVTDTEQWEYASESFPELGDLKSSVKVGEDKAVAESDDSILGVAKSPIAADDDLQIVGDETPNVAGDVEVVAEEEVPTVVSEMETGAEAEMLESGLGANSPVGTGDGETVAEGGILLEVTEMVPTVVSEMETGAEAEMLESGLGANSPVGTGDGETVAEGGILLEGTEMEIKCEVTNSTRDGGTVSKDEILMAGTEVEMKGEVANSPVAAVNGGTVADGGTLMAGVSNSEVATGDGGGAAEGRILMAGVANSEVETGDGQGVAEGELLMASTETEMKSEVESVEGGVSKSDPRFDKLEQVKSPVVEEEAVEEIAGVGNEMEFVNEFEAIESSGGKFVCELGDLQKFGAESFAAKETDDDESMEKGETGMEDTEMESENEVENEVGMTSLPQLDNSHNVGADSLIVSTDDHDDNEEVGTQEETPIADTETEIDVGEMAGEEKGVGGGGGKRKRGKNSGVPARAPSRRVVEEDVCFICFDGGELVLCDRRGCPKAYHPSCVNRDEAFFRAKGRWNCGWHLCSICEKNAYYMCYTCTFSLCRACIKDAVILCVRGNKGFCETCMKTVMLIENNEQADKENRVDFDDKSSWEYLFKDYWIDLKAKLSLSSFELTQATYPWKGSDVLTGKQESPEEVFDANNDQGSGSESSETLEASKNKRRKSKRRLKSLIKDENLPSSRATIGDVETSIPGPTEWASKELLEFVMHMKNGEKSALSQFDVQAMLLEYIKTNKLRDPRRKSQIICDARLENLFGKARVGHFEMLKLLESHFLVKEDSQTDDIQGTVVDTEDNQLEADGTIDAPAKGSKYRKRKMRKKGDDRGPQSNLDDYAAIDMHNISLIYLRRKLVEDLLEDMGKFETKVVGTFVRIRISGSNQKQDMYRLVKVVGTRKAAEPYKVGKKTTDLMLEILNLNKMEVVPIDTISNQEFTEDECKRLRQSIKCGLIDRLDVGGILEKAMQVQEARVNDWLEAEILRLSHLRDRASDLGRRKELRECVEKLQLLKTRDERVRRLEEIPKIHADPNMHPDYESDEHDSEMEDDKQEILARPRGSVFSRKGREPISPRRGSFSSPDSWSGTKKDSGKNWELNRNLSNKDFSNKAEEAALVGELTNENTWNQGSDNEGNMEKVNSGINSETVGRNLHSFARSESFSGAALETSHASLAPGASEIATKINEMEKIWHYQDPSAKVQGPFSLVQLRKWNNTGYFPADLKIWRSTEKQEDSLLLTDALAGRFQKELPSVDNNFTKTQPVQNPHLSSTPTGKPYGASLQEGNGGEGVERLRFDQSHGVQSQPSSSSGWGTPSIEVPKVSDYVRNDSINLPSPTPISSTPRWTGGQASERKWSSPVQQAASVLGVNSFPGGNGPTHSPAVITRDGGQLTRPSASSSVNQSGNKEHIQMESFGVSAPHTVLNSSMGLLRGSENASSNILPSSTPVPNSEQVIPTGPTTALLTSQTIMTSESHGQTAGSDPQTWGRVSSQNLEPNPSLPVPVQPAAYGHWGGIQTVQNTSGNFSTPGFAAFPQPDPWRPPVAGNQPNIQQAPPSVPWGMGTPQSNASAPGPRPDNPSTVWGPVQGNPNMGWVGAVPGTTNMNWGPAVQVPGAVNAGWVATTGNPGTMFQAMPPGNANPGWVAQPGNPGSAVQGAPPGNGNPGWVAPTGNPGFNQGQVPGNVNPVWVPSTGNPGTTVQGQAPGNANAGWGLPPAGNQGTTVQGPAPGNANAGYGGNPGGWGNEKQHGGDSKRFSGQRDRGFQRRDSGGYNDGGRRWNSRPSSSSSGGQIVCKFYQHGHCKKGSSCDMLHT
ncbi:zinc finger CCCH domain-containing protein 19-like [Actinidia eriantha]|uniref:zinc finger CCCH domain-containing protein 19-like n=1 Tax=Actinidia eriantha TaxID=165200 RepID=UPI0025908BB6|nr:zinc finger CCCH domain-containing protein 19-like [Actinidia eriantha]